MALSARVVIKRIVVTAGVVLAILLGSLIVWGEVTSRITSKRLRNRTAYWTSQVDAGVTVGETRDQAERWLRKTIPTAVGDAGLYDSYNHSLVAYAETIQVVGAHFPCSAWVIVVDIQLGPDNRVTSRKVRQSGLCV